VHPVEGHPRQPITNRDLHAQEPIELPATLIPDRVGQLAAQRALGFQPQIERAEELPCCDGAARDVLAIVAGVVPTPRDVELALAAPTGVEPLSVYPGPRPDITSPFGCPACPAGRP
jgi:hypothetical protein